MPLTLSAVSSQPPTDILHGAAEITQLYHARFGDEHIAGLDVAVQDAIGVQIKQGLEKLKGNFADDGEIEGVDHIIDVILETRGAVLHEQQVLVRERLGVIHLDDVLVVQFAVDSDFTFKVAVEFFRADDFFESVEFAFVW